MMTLKKKRSRRRVSQCKNVIAGVKCPGKYLLTYANNAPIFTCEKCGDQELTWQKFYDEYLQLYKVKDNWDNKKHQVSCILGFFCSRYKKHYDTDYVFVPQNPNPYGAKEVRDAWALLSAFQGDAHEVRRYIYWFFTKAIGRNTDITSFGYLKTPNIIRKYKLYLEKKKAFTRASKLPKNFIAWCDDNVPDIFANYELNTMNDLGALLGYVKAYSNDINPESSEFRVIAQATKMNLIKDDKLNIRD